MVNHYFVKLISLCCIFFVFVWHGLTFRLLRLRMNRRKMSSFLGKTGTGNILQRLVANYGPSCFAAGCFVALVSALRIGVFTYHLRALLRILELANFGIK